MKDFPLFDTQYGVASLILKEIPYKGLAFIHILQAEPENFREHLEECVSFCRMAGAERILAKGHGALEQYPLHSIVYRMSLTPEPGEPEACLWPVTEETAARWREIYNKAMQPFDNHATLTARDEKKLTGAPGAYFVHRDGQLLGIGWMEGNELLAVASTVPGMGQTVTRTLLSTVEADSVTLQVVSTNHRAIRLYERMGFIKTGEVSRWYRVL